MATINDLATDSCNGAKANHSKVATTAPHLAGSVAFISLQEGAPASPKPAVIDKIIATVRSPT